MKISGNHILLTIEEYNRFLHLEQELMIVKDDLAKLRKLLFGKKNERIVKNSSNPEVIQPSLFDDLEIPEKPKAEETETETETITYERKKPKKKPKRKQLPAYLKRIEEIILPENLPEDARRIGELITEVLEYEPSRIYVRRIIRPKFFLPKEEKIVTSELPSNLPLPHSNASAGLLAHLIVSKILDHLPFYRISKIFKRQKIELPDSTINQWFVSVSRLLQPLYEVLKKEVLSQDYLQVDESYLSVQSNEKKGTTHRGYMWVFHSPPSRLVFFDYHKGRNRKAVSENLHFFQGILQTDGYAVYDIYHKKEGVTLAACMAHARRKFVESLNYYKEQASYVITRIRQLYEIERFVKENKYSYEEIKEYRQKKAKPILLDIEIYLRKIEPSILPKSNLGKAIAYTLSLMPRLKVYLTDGRINIDNNLIENTIRPLALGRKNYLFAGSHEGAQRLAMMYSFLISCKLRDVEPYQWLKETLEKILDYKANRLKELLPGYNQTKDL